MSKEEQIMDFVQFFPEEICRNIFKKLSVEDLLNASLVCWQWYDLIARSPECMSKMRLNFSYDTSQVLTKIIKKILEESPRRYEAVKFSRHSKLIGCVTEILASREGWKSVEITRITFSNSSECMKLLAAIEPDVEELKMEIVLVDNIDEEDPKASMSFPKLKVLMGKYIHVSIYCMALENCKTLQEFDFSIIDHSTKSIEVTKNMLRRNKNLKKLTVSCDFLSTFFSENLSANIEFKLTSFDAQVIYNFTDTHKLHLKLFLESQMQHLETLSLGYWMGQEALEMIFHMMKLKKLIFKGFHGGGTATDWKNIKFHKNHTVTTLHLNEWNSQADFLKTFFLALPNLRSLKLLSITDESLACIATAFPNLETLRSDQFDVSSIPEKDVLPKLKYFSSQAFRHNLKSAENQEIGNFAKLVLAKMKETPPPIKRSRMQVQFIQNRHPFQIDEDSN